MISSINYAQWLNRLGFKLAQQPPTILTAQPVRIVGDDRSLVSPSLGVDYAVGFGAVNGGAAEFASGHVICPAPLWIRSIQFASATNMSVGMRISGAAQVLAGPNNPTPMLFQPGQIARAVWTVGRDGVGFGLDGPVTRTVQPPVRDIFVPAGQVFQFWGNQVNVQIQFYAICTELPSENAQ